MARHPISLPPYMQDSSAPALLATESLYSVPAPVKSNRKSRPARPSSKSRVVDLLLNESHAHPLNEAWPDEHPLRRQRVRRRSEFQNVAIRAAKVGVGASLLVVMGMQSLVKGWTKSEIWVKNAVLASVLTVFGLHLVASCVDMLGSLVQIQTEMPAVAGIYESHQKKNDSLKSQIKQALSGEDAELMARNYFDMVSPDEILIKIKTPD